MLGFQISGDTEKWMHKVGKQLHAKNLIFYSRVKRTEYRPVLLSVIRQYSFIIVVGAATNNIHLSSALWVAAGASRPRAHRRDQYWY